MFNLEQPLLIKTIDNMIKKARVPQAFIYYGESGTSKKDVAKYFIKELYKKELNLSDDDLILKRIDDESHINVKYIKRDKETTISKDLIDETINTQNRTSLEEGPRVYIIEDAAYLNKSSMNELLKFVEEPFDNTYIIFMLDNLSHLQDTIISRCSLFHFVPVSLEQIVERLKEDEDDINLLKAFTLIYQNEEIIKDAIKDENKIKIYESVVDMFKERFEEKESLILYFNEHSSFIKDEQLLYVSVLNLFIEDLINVEYKSNITFLSMEERIKQISDLLSLKFKKDLLNKSLEIKKLVQEKKSINLELYIINLLLSLEMKARM